MEKNIRKLKLFLKHLKGGNLVDLIRQILIFFCILQSL